MAKRKTVATPESGTWSVGRVTPPVPVMDQGRPIEPEVVLWLDQRGRVYTEICEGPDEREDAVREGLKKIAAASPRPSEVRVADELLLSPVRKALGEGVAIHVARDPQMLAALSALSAALSGGGAGTKQADLYAEDVPAASFARFHAAAAHLYEARPWRIIPSDSDLLAVDIPAHGVAGGAVSIIGQMGESHGVLLFRSLADFNRFRRAGVESGGQPEMESLGDCHILSMNFDHQRDIPPQELRHLKDRGARDLGDGHFPFLMCVAGAQGARSAERADLEVSAVLAEALVGFLTEHAIKLQATDAGPLVSTVTLPDLPGAPTVTLRYPHPQADTLDDLEELEEASPYDDLLVPFLGDMETAGQDVSWLEQADTVCDMLCYFHDEVQGQDLSSWSATDFEQFMLKFFPDMMDEDLGPDLAPLVPEILIAFATWLREEQTLTARAAAAIVKRIEGARERFLLAVQPDKPAKKRRK